jgi:2-polyprenyl-3-methyl-5-hydroxy-6-metoxy-1,4-benzoquinol methylase
VFTLPDDPQRIYRAVTSEGARDFQAFLASPPAGRLLSSGRIMHSTPVAGLRRERLLACYPDAALLLEHERIPFPSYPAEWPPEMLHAAASLTLELASAFLPHNIGLKDATPCNVLFRGHTPVFVDVLSFEPRDPGDSTWAPYGQFLRTFLLPLLVNRHLGMPLDQIFATRRDGLEPEEVLRCLSPLQRVLPPYLSLVSLPAWLGKRHNQDDATVYQKRILADPEKAQYILQALFRRMARLLASVAPAAGRTSTWSDYLASNNNYSADHFAVKQAFVGEALSEFAPQRVLDAGCNTGHFSVLAARSGAEVTAIDYDPVVVGSLWSEAQRENLDILPLVVNVSRPTPATGWNNRETSSFLDRARGHFDAVLMLALIHHLLVTERIPLDAILDLAANLASRGGSGIAVIEFIAPEDSMFRRLVRGRDELYRHLTRERFEAAARRRFEIVRTRHCEGTHRWLYLLCRRG